MVACPWMPASAGMTDEIPLSLRREDMGRGRAHANRPDRLSKGVGDEMDYASCRSLPAMFFEVAQTRAARPFLWAKREGSYRSLSWTEAADAVTRLARGLAALGIEPGDRVALVSENRPEWVIADLAIMSAGAVTVPAYVTNTVEDHRHILGNSGARAAIVSTAALAARLLPAAAQVPSVRAVIAIEDVAEAPPHLDLRRWEAVLALGGESGDAVAARVAALTQDDTACIIYTSGTGGVPKGVMLSHRNIIANCRGAYRLLEMLGLGDEKFLSFLPLSHSYEHTAGMMFPISLGAEIYFAEGAETLATNLIEVRPTIMTAVPRLYETLHQRIRLADRARARAEARPVRARRRDRQEAARRRALVARRAAPRSGARKAGARQGARAVRRALEGDDLGRGAAQPRDRRLLPRARGAAPAGLWPDRGGAGDLLQPARE